MNKIKKQIFERIKQEIENSPIDNWHGITLDNITKHLISPVFETYSNPMDETITHQYWTVLEEYPEDRNGYTIFFDTNENEFGLGMHVKSKQMISLGIYGSFIEALNGM